MQELGRRSGSTDIRRPDSIGYIPDMWPPGPPVAGVTDRVVAVAAECDEVGRRQLLAAGVDWQDVMHLEILDTLARLAERLSAEMLLADGAPPA